MSRHLITRIDVDEKTAEVLDAERASVVITDAEGRSIDPGPGGGVTNRLAGETLAEVLGHLGAVLDSERDHVCRDQDDDYFRGARITDLWVVTLVGDDDQEAIVNVPLPVAVKYSVDVGPAFASDEHRLHHMREVAKSAAANLGEPVKIIHLKLDGEEVFLPPPTVTNDLPL